MRLANNISTDYSLATQFAPQVAAYGSGNAIAVWIQSDGVHHAVWASRYDEDTGWGPAIRMQMSAGDALNPQVDVDAHGNAIVIWKLQDGLQNTLWASRYNVNEGWGTSTPLEGSDNAASADLAVDPAGNAIIVWREPGSPNYVVSASRYVVGAGWSNAEEVGTTDDGVFSAPEIAVDGRGNAVVVWNRESGIWANRYDVVHGWSAPTLIGPVGAGVSDTTFPGVDVDGSGNAIAVWSATVAGGRVSVSNRFVLGSGWGGTTIVGDRSGEPYFDRSLWSGKQVAVDAWGAAVVAWAEWNHGGLWGPSDVSATNYVIGAGWQRPVRLCCEEVASVGNPRVAVDSGGNTVIVWAARVGDRAGVWANWHVPGEGWNDPTYLPVLGDPLWGGTPVDVAADSAGNAYVAWQQLEGGNVTVWAANYARHSILTLPLDPSEPLVLEALLRELAFVRSIALAAIVGLIASVVVIIFLFRMTWKRWPRSPYHSEDELNAANAIEKARSEVGPSTPNAPAAIAPARPAGRRWPTKNAGTIGVRLIAKERILLHLVHFSRYADSSEVAPELTQERIVEATGVNRRHFAQYVRPLIQDGLVQERRADVRGALQRRRVYVLTEEGMRKAMEIRDRIRSVVIRMRDASGERDVTIAEALLEAKGSMSILDILRASIETGVVDVRH